MRKLSASRARFRRLLLPGPGTHRRCPRHRPGVSPCARPCAGRRACGGANRCRLRLSAHVTRVDHERFIGPEGMLRLISGPSCRMCYRTSRHRAATALSKIPKASSIGGNPCRSIPSRPSPAENSLPAPPRSPQSHSCAMSMPRPRRARSNLTRFPIPTTPSNRTSMPAPWRSITIATRGLRHQPQQCGQGSLECRGDAATGDPRQASGNA